MQGMVSYLTYSFCVQDPETHTETPTLTLRKTENIVPVFEVLFFLKASPKQKWVHLASGVVFSCPALCTEYLLAKCSFIECTTL